MDGAELRADIVVTSRQATHETSSKTISDARVIPTSREFYTSFDS